MNQLATRRYPSNPENPPHPFETSVSVACLRDFSKRQTVRLATLVWTVALPAFLTSCSRDERPTTPAEQSLKEIPLPGAAGIIGAGDNAVCGTNGGEETRRLLDSPVTPPSLGNLFTAVFTLRDNSSPSGADGVDNHLPRF